MDVALAIDEEAVPVILKERGADSYDDSGNAVKGRLKNRNIMSAIQPASATTLRDLPEGVRTEVSYVGWTRVDVKTDDLIEYFGEDFRIVHIMPRPQDGFTKYALKRFRDE